MYSQVKCFIKKIFIAIAKGFCMTGMCDSLSYNPFYTTYGIGMVRHYSYMEQQLKTIERTTK